MKKILFICMALCLFISIANAELKLSWEMDSADDFNLGEDIGGAAGRTYVTNAVTGELAAGMTADSTVYFDPAQGALRMSGSGYNSQIYGEEDPTAIFTSKTQYTFSLWAKGDLNAVSGNGYNFYLFWSDGSKFKCDLSFKETAAACFTAPGGSWVNNAYNIWNPDPNYSDRYVNPESWNMYTFTWDADNDYIATYVNGVLRASWDNDGNDIPAIDSAATVDDYGFGDGYNFNGPGGWYKNYQIWDEALDAATIADFCNKAQLPSPHTNSNLIAEGNTVDLTLSWRTGNSAASHDLYIGTDFDDVNNADNFSGLFQGSLANNTFDITVQTANTYYWRVDEVNDIDVWKGDVWSFNVTAVPVPKLLWEMDSEDDFTIGGDDGSASGRLYVDNKITGNKYAGMTATGGIVFDEDEGAIYFDGAHPGKIYGMNGNAVGDDPNLIFTSNTQYTFSLFAKGDLDAVSGNGYSFYLFWDDGSKFKCDLSFKPTAAACFTSPGGGWQNNAYHIWDTDPSYADRYVDPETWNMYTFTWDVDNQYIATYVNGIERAHYASGTAITPGAAITDFGFGDGYGWHSPGGWYKDYRVYDTALDSDQINFILGDFLLYPKSPSPKDNSTDIELDGTVLTWSAGIETVYQDVYFGTDEIAVKNADTSSSTYQGQIALENTFDPGALELMKTYYWRVDQLDENSGLIVKGDVWNFSTLERVLVEDFESYDEVNDVTVAWVDVDTSGAGDMQRFLATDPGYPVLSMVNSLRLRYRLTAWGDLAYYAKTRKTFSSPQDWTVNGVKVLSLNYYGDEGNFDLPMFVTVGDGTTEASVYVAADTTVESWNEANASLDEIAAAGVDLTNVTYMEIGFGDGTNLGSSSSQYDMIFVDDIALYPPKCVVSESSLLADITQDCVVNYDDLNAFALNWLLAGYTVTAQPVSDDDMVLHYDFENNTTDSVAGNNGTLQNLGSTATYDTGHNGGKCIHFNATATDSGSNMTIPAAAFASLEDEVTFSFWLKKDESEPSWYQALFAGHGVAVSHREIFMGYAPARAGNMVTMFTGGSDGPIRWSSEESVSFIEEGPFDYTAWNHYAMVKNGKLGYMYLYVNGELKAFESNRFKPITDCDKFVLGSYTAIDGGDSGFAKASFDDFRMYDRALSHAEVLTLAEQTSATVSLSTLDDAAEADFNTDEAVDFKDYAILAGEWLVEDLWP